MKIAEGFDFGFPKGRDLHNILQLNQGVDLEDLFEKSLMEPMMKILERPRKSLRGQLVEIGFSLAERRAGISRSDASLAASDSAGLKFRTPKISDLESQDPVLLDSKKILSQAVSIIELLHTGSLVIDDIEDGSLLRRGLPAVHALYGVPIALNAGNWLYFLPFKLIEQMELSREQREELSRDCQNTLLRAHYGQALDLGVPFDSIAQERIPEVSAAIIELKAGALSAFAMKLGAISAGGCAHLHSKIEAFGKSFGIALQMLDDIGNLCCTKDPSKVLEDLRLRKMTFLVSVAAQKLTPTEFNDWLAFAKVEPLNHEEQREFLDRHSILNRARDLAKRQLELAIEQLQVDLQLDAEEKERIESLCEKLMRAYE